MTYKKLTTIYTQIMIETALLLAIIFVMVLIYLYSYTIFNNIKIALSGLPANTQTNGGIFIVIPAKILFVADIILLVNIILSAYLFVLLYHMLFKKKAKL
ncbi:MAG: hypothetical protein QXL94_07030 [Candidatus Parvarchaeum sp.]